MLEDEGGAATGGLDGCDLVDVTGRQLLGQAFFLGEIRVNVSWERL